MSATKDYLSLMLMHCEKVIHKTKGKSISDWGMDENLRDAVCMRLLALGDCAKAYLKENQDIPVRYPHIPWDEIARFRDKAAHHYEGMDYDLVWEIVETDVSPLYEALQKLCDGQGISSTRER